MTEVTELDEIGWPLHSEGGERPTHYADGKPDSCPECRDMPQDYRSPAGHLKLDPESGATILEPHQL